MRVSTKRQKVMKKLTKNDKLVHNIVSRPETPEEEEQNQPTAPHMRKKAEQSQSFKKLNEFFEFTNLIKNNFEDKTKNEEQKIAPGKYSVKQVQQMDENKLDKILAEETESDD